jgi:histidyl-tRNA synthetase
MRHFSIAVFALLCLSAYIATAQSSPAQLCVANMQSVNAGTDTIGRDMLMNFLSKEKNKSVAQDILVDASEPEQALQQAKSKNCDYLLTTRQTENHQENSQMQAMGTFGQTSMPTYYVTTTYKLTRVSDGSDVASGNLKASDRGSEQNALGFTLHKIADKVTETIKKAGH